MPSVRKREDNGCLFLDFRYRGKRFREQTLLPDTPQNRNKLEKVLARIESEIKAGTFSYEAYFPNGKGLQRLASKPQETAATPAAPTSVSLAIAETVETRGVQTLAFEQFANQWVDERSIEWRRSHIKSLLSTLNGRLIPRFQGKAVGSITKSDILAFRAELAKVPGRGGKDRLSSKRINEIIGLLCQILDEAADRFQFTPATNGIRRLKVPRADVNPFSLAEVESILATVRADYRCYFTVRFFTAMRTGEVHGLKWKYVDFERRLILVRETFVLDQDDYTKNDGSQRDIQMSQPVFDALKLQYEATGRISEYVFCNVLGRPLDNKNFTDRVWYPLLRHLGLDRRRPYQMRHTAATLWLASGEAPEWIARQMGHTSTEMLFRVYSRYVPNLTRQDGSAMERLLASRVALANTLQDHRDAASGTTLQPAATPAMPVPKLRGAIARQVQGNDKDQDKRPGDAPPAPRAKPPPAYAAYA